MNIDTYNFILMKSSPQKIKSQQLRRKQIENTLNELHRLQAEIYELNIPQNPHSNPPVKKEIKQLAYLYENMTKPKTKNNLNVSIADIQKTFNLIDPSGQEKTTNIDSKKLSKVMKNMFGSELELGLIKKDDAKYSRITSQELHQFINYNEFDHFDPIHEAYTLFIDEEGRFNMNKFQQFSGLLGLPPINSDQVFIETLGLNSKGELKYEKFAQIMKKS